MGRHVKVSASRVTVLCLDCKTKAAICYGRCNLHFLHWRRDHPTEYRKLRKMTRAQRAAEFARQRIMEVAAPKPWEWEGREDELIAVTERQQK